MHTHTYVVLEISQVAYDEIAAKLKAADYSHCFNADGEIDMAGIAVQKQEPAPPDPLPQIPTGGFIFA